MSYGSGFQRFVYSRSPYFIKSIIAGFYGWATFSKKNGQFYRDHLNRLSESQWFSTQELLNLQEEKTLKFIEYAYNHIPYYRELFQQNDLVPSDIRCLNDIRKIPILTKETVRQDLERLFSEDFGKKDLIWAHTSGTTGKALELCLSKECFQREYAFTWLHRSWGGVDRKNDKIVTFAGHPVVPIDRIKPPFWTYNLYERQLLCSSYHLSKDNLAYYARKLDEFQPDFIHGYPSSIYLVSRYLLEHGINTIRPKCVVTASETIFDYQRQEIESAFGCRLLMWYGNTEMCANIVECPDGGLHIKHEHSHVEFLDESNEPVKSGGEGRMVCTGFGNYAMPLLRYEIGDVAIPIHRECSCGRGGYLVERVVGREEDYVVTPDGRLVGRLDHLFKDALNVVEAQLVQETTDKLLVRIVKRPGYSKEDEEAILSEAYNRLGNSIQIDLDYVDRIPRTSNGKLKFIISKIDLGKLKIPG
ncbi:phenylacetate--CoA ligase family protein [Candidatus Poribacteria bacterium]